LRDVVAEILIWPDVGGVGRLFVCILSFCVTLVDVLPILNIM